MCLFADINARGDSATSLKDSLDRLSDYDRRFAEALLAQLDERGHLSTKQWYWVETLAQRCARREEFESVADVTARSDAFPGLVSLFATAKESKLKRPRITLTTETGTVRLSVAGDRSKTPGAINITDGGSFGENTWYGRVFPEDGRFQRGRNCTDEVVDLLRRLDSDPQQFVGEHGKRTGVCCFCAQALTDERSVAVGYGPICAAKYGLPWGEEDDA